MLLTLSTGYLNYDWAEGWIRTMKRDLNLAPSTIRHRYGALARCFDWMVRKHADIMAQNPLRLLKRGFSSYSDEDQRFLAGGKKVKHDEERDRRLDSDEEARILAVLSTMPDERVMLLMALESAMRMRECYTLNASQVSLPKKTVYLDRTKNGDNRQVPLTTPAQASLREYMRAYADAIKAREGRLFPFWKGDASVKNLDSTTADLSRVYREIFAAADVQAFHFHDLLSIQAELDVFFGHLQGRPNWCARCQSRRSRKRPPSCR